MSRGAREPNPPIKDASTYAGMESRPEAARAVTVRSGCILASESARLHPEAPVERCGRDGQRTLPPWNRVTLPLHIVGK